MSEIISKSSYNIIVSVENSYQDDFSNPMQSQYVFEYHIRIENKNNDPVQLLKRHWNIKDGMATHRIVEGDGVVGTQAIIQSQEKFEYTSLCNIETPQGTMQGYYSMINLNTHEIFDVEIPQFFLFYPFIFN